MSNISITRSLLASLLPCWHLALRAERKSAGTIKVYTHGVNKFLSWCEENAHSAELMKTTVGLSSVTSVGRFAFYARLRCAAHRH